MHPELLRWIDARLDGAIFRSHRKGPIDPVLALTRLIMGALYEALAKLGYSWRIPVPSEDPRGAAPRPVGHDPPPLAATLRSLTLAPRAPAFAPSRC